MNALNSLIFAALGVAMEMLPKAFPALFPHSGADSASARALWLDVMGAVQVFLGLGYILRVHVLPFVARVVAIAPTGEAGALELPNTRAVNAR